MRQSTGTARLSAVPVFVSFDASTPCLSPWERWLSEAKTERGIKPSQFTCGDSSPRGRAKGRHPAFAPNFGDGGTPPRHFGRLAGFPYILFRARDL